MTQGARWTHDADASAPTLEADSNALELALSAALLAVSSAEAAVADLRCEARMKGPAGRGRGDRSASSVYETRENVEWKW